MAKNNIIRNNLGYLGEDFQLQLVKYFIEDPKFFISIVQIVDQNMFTDEHLRRIVGIMKDRYTKVGTCPKYLDLEIILRAEIQDSITLEIILAKLTKLKSIVFSGIDIIRDNAEKFFKQQNLAKAINKCTEILKRGNVDNYYAMEDLINKALNTNMTQEMGFHVFDYIEDDLQEDFRCTIPTGADKLDESLYGGLGKGELGIVISPMGVGKTSSMTGFAAHAATTKTKDNNEMGYKVLHFFFEDLEAAIRRKYFAFVTNVDACDLSKPDVRPLIIEQLKNEKNEQRQLIQQNIIARRLTTGEVSASDIKYMIQQYISKGFIPDMVIIDYFECLKPERGNDSNSSEWSQEGITMRKLESIANEFNVAMWVPIQSTKGAIGQEYVGMMHGGGSVKKTQIGHVVITLAQTDEQKEQGKLNMFIGKLRAARIGRTSFLNVKFNNGTCKFDMSELDSIDNEPFEDLSGKSVNETYQAKAKMIAKATK